MAEPSVTALLFVLLDLCSFRQRGEPSVDVRRDLLVLWSQDVEPVTSLVKTNDCAPPSIRVSRKLIQS
jgi:hypothetical protein